MRQFLIYNKVLYQPKEENMSLRKKVPKKETKKGRNELHKCNII